MVTGWIQRLNQAGFWPAWLFLLLDIQAGSVLGQVEKNAPQVLAPGWSELEFNPPEVMKRYGRPYIADGFDWRFLTTSGPKALEPVLESYGQSIIRDPNAGNGDAGNISHVLRVFLIDSQLRIRNIFSASYLHADTMLNDIRAPTQ